MFVFEWKLLNFCKGNYLKLPFFVVKAFSHSQGTIYDEKCSVIEFMMNWNGCKFGNQEIPKGTNALNKNTSGLEKINYLSIDLMSDL